MAARSARQFIRRSKLENFIVFSRLLPSDLAADVASVYAFCRYADDLADESPSAAEALQSLDECERQLRLCFNGEPTESLFIDLAATIKKHALTIDPFLDLLSAFRQDQRVNRYADIDSLLDYCRRSANPVGRIVLKMIGHTPSEAQLAMSDDTCTGLQFINFWQDVRRDILDRDRIYIPADIAAAQGLSLDDLRDRVRSSHRGVKKASAGPAKSAAATKDSSISASRTRGMTLSQDPLFAAAYRATMLELCDRTAALFDAGEPLARAVPRDAQPMLSLFTAGGRATLRRLRAIDYRSDLRRPAVSPLAKAALVLRASLAQRLARA